MTATNNAREGDGVAEWRCFHCDEVFTTHESAVQHFGESERRDPACTVDIEKYRAMEDEVDRCRDEDGPIHRAMYAQQSAHQQALIRAEEAGYAKALKDTGYTEPALQAQQGAAPKEAGDGVALIAAERQRQVSVEGWTTGHDDAHDEEELASAAACYACPAWRTLRQNQPPLIWPWDENWWKPGDRIRELTKAGALIAAEIDRLQRLANPPVDQRQEGDTHPAGRDAKDAARYRMLRDPPSKGDAMCAWSTTQSGDLSATGKHDGPRTGAGLDAILDAALNQEPQK